MSIIQESSLLIGQKLTKDPKDVLTKALRGNGPATVTPAGGREEGRTQRARRRGVASMGCGQSKAGAVAVSGSGHQPANRPTLPPVELRGGKLGNFAGMVRTIEAHLERSLEDVTGPIDSQQVHKRSRYPQPSRLELSCLCFFFLVTQA